MPTKVSVLLPRRWFPFSLSTSLARPVRTSRRERLLWVHKPRSVEDRRCGCSRPVVGTSRTKSDVHCPAAFGGKADIDQAALSKLDYQHAP